MTRDKVYYKRADCPEWKGPGIVIGQDGAVVFVRHGGTLVRVHQSRLRKINTQDQKSQVEQTLLDSRETASEKSSLTSVAESSDSKENISDREVNTGEMVHPNMTQIETDVCGNPVSSAGVKLKTGQTITFMKRDGGGLQRAKVLGRAGKASGKHKSWFNLQHIEPDDSDGQKESVDMSCVDNLNTESTDKETDVLITKEFSFDAAKQDEIMNWYKNNVFEEVDDAGQKCVSTRWVCSLKETPNGIMPKARFVAIPSL